VGEATEARTGVDSRLEQIAAYRGPMPRIDRARRQVLFSSVRQRDEEPAREHTPEGRDVPFRVARFRKRPRREIQPEYDRRREREPTLEPRGEGNCPIPGEEERRERERTVHRP